MDLTSAKDNVNQNFKWKSIKPRKQKEILSESVLETKKGLESTTISKLPAKVENQRKYFSKKTKVEIMASPDNSKNLKWKQRKILSESVLETKKRLESTTSSKLPVKVHILLICIVVVLVFLNEIKCCDKLDAVVLKSLLNKNVFGQNEAVEHIVSALENDNRKLLIIYGGTGVGKTYAVSLIFQNSWNSSNVFYYAMPTTKDILIRNTHWGSLLCSSVIFVFDGLGSNDFDIAHQIESIFAISPSQNITVIVIYNCDEVSSNFKKTCSDDWKAKLIEEFSAVSVVQKEFIKFESLSKMHLRQCIDKALDGHRLEELQYENLLNNFNVDMDGCKGVESKIQLFKQSS